MPKVGEKHFAYTKAGRAAAKREAARTGMPMHDEMHSDMPMAMDGMGESPMLDMRGANQRRYPKKRGQAFKPSDLLVSMMLR